MPPGPAPTRWLVSNLCCRFLKLEVQAYRSVHQTVQPSLFKIARSFTKVIIILLVSFEIHLMIPIWLRLHLSYSDSSSLTPITSPLSRGRAELLGINTTEPDPISPRARSMRFTSYSFLAGAYLKNCNKIGICLGNKKYFLLSDSDSNSAVCGLYQYAPSNSHCQCDVAAFALQNRFVSFLGMVSELTGISVDTGSIYFVQVSYRILEYNAYMHDSMTRDLVDSCISTALAESSWTSYRKEKNEFEISPVAGRQRLSMMTAWSRRERRLVKSPFECVHCIVSQPPELVSHTHSIYIPQPCM